MIAKSGRPAHMYMYMYTCRRRRVQRRRGGETIDQALNLLCKFTFTQQAEWGGEVKPKFW